MIQKNSITTDISYTTSHGAGFSSEGQAKYCQHVIDLSLYISSKTSESYADATISDITKCIIDNRVSIIAFLRTLNG